VYVFGDCAINVDPTAQELSQIAISSAATAAAFGIEPRVAMLSYATGQSNTGPIVDKASPAPRQAPSKARAALCRARRRAREAMDPHPRPRLPHVTRRGPEQVREATSLALAGAPGVAIEGPTQFDAAVDAEVAAIKMKVPEPPAARSRNRSVHECEAVMRADRSLPQD
jgi:phosphotransacetylase